MKAAWCKYRLEFNFVARTSRETMRHKDTYFILLEEPGRVGLGEAALFRGLSADDRPDYEDVLRETCAAINRGDRVPDLSSWSSIRFGLKSALADIENGARQEPFVSGQIRIPINGLIWIDDFDSTVKSVEKKIHTFEVIKIKVGQLSPDEEAEILRLIRRLRPDIAIRLDANGAFHSYDEAMERIAAYAPFHIHSIEQPVPARNYDLMASVIKDSPVKIALDEELIGIDTMAERRELIGALKPDFVVLKPSLCGGFEGTSEWIKAAADIGAGWWITSALESNVGLNAIARYTSTLPYNGFCQGLGTGQIYRNNVVSPLRMDSGFLVSDPSGRWEMPDVCWSEP